MAYFGGVEVGGGTVPPGVIAASGDSDEHADPDNGMVAQVCSSKPLYLYVRVCPSGFVSLVTLPLLS